MSTNLEAVLETMQPDEVDAAFRKYQQSRCFHTARLVAAMPDPMDEMMKGVADHFRQRKATQAAMKKAF